MNIKWKIISLVMMLIMASCITFTFLIISQDKKNLQAETEREVSSIKAIVELLEKEKYQGYQRRIHTIATSNVAIHDGLIASFAAKDRNTLLKKSNAIFKVLKQENPYFSALAWITADNKSFLRVHNPQAKVGDDISKMRPDIVRANKLLVPISGYQVAKTGLFYRLIHPIKYAGKHVGAIQFGIETTLLLDSIHEKLDLPIAIVMTNSAAKFVSKTTTPKWQDKNYTLFSNQLNLFNSNIVSLDWSSEQQRITNAGNSYRLIRVFDFKNFANEPQGSLFVALDTTIREKKLSQNLLLISLISAAVLIFSFIVLNKNYGKLVGTIEALNDKLQKQNSDLETTVNQRTASLQQSEERFKKLSELTFEGIVLHRQGVALDVNESMINLFGYQRDELIGNNLIELLVFTEDQQIVHSNINAPKSVAYEVRMRKKDGTIIPVEIESKNVEDENSNYRVTAIRNISERKQVERKYEILVQEASMGIALAVAETGEIVECNDALTKMVKRDREELIGQHQSILHPKEPLTENLSSSFIQHRDGSPSTLIRKQLITKLGELLEVEIRAQKIEYNGVDMMFGLFQDITEQLKLEEQLRQKYKMEAIGVMAGGIAHNFNNSLALVLGNLEMAERKFSELEKVKTYIENAKIATMRARDLVNQIMTYSRQGENKEVTISLAIVVAETQKLIQSTLPTTIQFNFDTTDEAAETMVNADLGRIQEALLNLCNNAVQAMNEKGTLSVCLKKVNLTQNDLPAQYQKCTPGQYIMLSINDTGCGIDQDILSRIFDPFFTTKGIHEGTGMGLASVQGIIEQHNGLIKVSSVPEQGTTFELYFPALESELTIAKSNEEIVIQQGTESILFVDDDQMILDLGKQMLIDLGYQVTTATSGQEALTMITQATTRFDLIITDQTMPFMTGEELAQQIRTLNSEVPIILSTGYSSKVGENDIEKYRISAYCRKPLRLAELSQSIRSLLDK